VYKVPDVWMRPGPGGKGRKIPGTLEAHANGFRCGCGCGCGCGCVGVGVGVGVVWV